MLTSKANTFCLYKVLYDYSDADHIMTRNEIEAKLSENYGIQMNRHTLRSSLIVLEEMGFEISDYEDNGQGYYLVSREFDTSEVRLLMDSVYFNSGIPPKQTDNLIKKLQGLMPEHKRKKYKSLSAASSSKKTNNKEIFFNIDILDEAIGECKKTEFDYRHYNFKKELEIKRKNKYIINPYALIAAREHYYLIGILDNEQEFRHFRIDKIKNIKILDEKFKKDKKLNLSRYADISTMMYSGKTVSATFRCKNSILDQLIDEFGQDAKIVPNKDEETFNATVTGTYEGLKIWAKYYIDSAEVLAPIELREDTIRLIKNNIYGV